MTQNSFHSPVIANKYYLLFSSRFCAECTAYYRDIICYGVCLFTIVNLLTVLLLSDDDLRVVKSVDGNCLQKYFNLVFLHNFE